MRGRVHWAEWVSLVLPFLRARRRVLARLWAD